MKTLISNFRKSRDLFLALVAMMIMMPSALLDASASNKDQQKSDTLQFVLLRGTVEDEDTGTPLPFATVAIEESNIATVSNSNGDFILKVPRNMTDKNIRFSFIGYEKKFVPVNAFSNKRYKVTLKMITVPLVEVSVFPSDPNLLIKAVMSRRDDNYLNHPAKMTAFYRETIKKGWRYVSLSEAVVEIYKPAYNDPREDKISLQIGRKSTDYEKLDTLAFRLQGGPYTATMLDIMKDPYLLFDGEMINYYNFRISNITRIEDRTIYVLSFEQKPHLKIPLFYGKLYIDTENLAVTQAVFNMNTDNKNEVARMFIKKKPLGAKVYPTEASYIVNYRQDKNGKWYFGYSRGQASFKVNWKRKLFNTNYHTTLEIAVTDWSPTEDKPFRGADRLKINAILEDEVSGFSDPDFWGDYNVIEPEQPIESAIKKIQRKLDRIQ
ncbi:carboxypeptidase-like regulatory domain-containing protein [Thermophagus sp. OGC60D27]|uniref:carboxypeptidase-like regulatory domain-containing protein n=1 Tax=Thermophagus sp. OGC60D27 TaxID=3458415 RepID=UPI00403817F4